MSHKINFICIISIIALIRKSFKISELEGDIIDLTQKTKDMEEYASVKARRTWELEHDKRVSNII